MSEIATLKDVSELITKGTTPTSIGGQFVSSGINFIKSESITNSKYLNQEVFGFIDEETDNKLKRSKLAKDDLLFSIAGAYLGKIGIVRDIDLPANTNQASGIVRLKKGIADVDYVYYYFSQNEINRYIQKLSSQSSQPNLNLELLGKLEFDLKDISTQQKIGSVLSSLDSKIELNNRINAELEAMAKTLYDYWFVQFDFPDKNGKPYKTSGGKMVWNNELKREIPKGWEVKELSVVASSIMRGISPKYIENGGICVLNQKCIRDKSINFEPSRRHDNESKDATSKLIQYGDVLVNSTGFGTLGRVALVKRLKEPITIVDSHITIVRCHNQNIKKLFLGYSMLIRQNEIEGLAEGSTGQTELSRINLGQLKMVIPPIEMQSVFENFINPQLQKIANNEGENEQLSELRDWLLPMLMNGQVTVCSSTTSYEIEEEMKMAVEPGKR
ncbi:MAG: hypothetical protein GZ094_19820 [Mariniphaga sp.]|nr:hypothetical protein [Mariniphaga sp.]